MTSQHGFSVVEGKALYAFENIQNRAAHVVSQLQRVVEVLLNLHKNEKVDVGVLTRVQRALPDLRISDIEKYSDHWSYHIPENADVLAQLWRIMGESFLMVADEIPNIRRALRFDDPEVQASFLEATGKPISSIHEFCDKKKAPPDTYKNEQEKIVRELMSQLEWVFIQRGEVLFKQGDEGDAVYVIADGLLRVALGEGEDEVVLADLGRHQIVGEMSLITTEPRSATVYAVRDSEICRLSKANFDHLVREHEELMGMVMRQIIERLKKTNVGKRNFPSPTAITILPLSDGLDEFAAGLARQLGQEVRTLHLNRTSVRNLVPKRMARSVDSDTYDYEFTAWLDDQEAQNEIIIYEAERTMSRWTERCIQRADRILLVGRMGADPSLSEVEQKLIQGGDQRLIAGREFVLVRLWGNQDPHGTADWLNPRKIDAYYQVALDQPEDFKRLLRILNGTATGLVLGGGGLRGSAHAGVYRAISELEIPIDFYGGNSAGAIAAAFFALGKSWKESLEISRENLIRRDVLLDTTFPVVGLNAGARITRAFEKMFGNVMIEDLPRPFYCVSTNLSKGRQQVHRTGRLAYALRASASLPAIYPPMVSDDGDLLVDGATVNNVPINIMQEMINGGPIIAVDVGSEDREEAQYAYRQYISGWRVLGSLINPFQKRIRVPNIAETITRTATMTSITQRESFAEQADLLIRPDVSQYGLFDVEAYDEVYEAGYKAALPALKAWLEPA